MHSDQPEIRPHKPKHAAERLEGLLGKLMIVVVAVVAIGLVYAIATGDTPPSWMH